MLSFDFSSSPVYSPPNAELVFNFSTELNYVVSQQILLPLDVTQSIAKRFTIDGSVSLGLSISQSIYKSIAGYAEGNILFEESQEIKQLSLTFDQLGQPLVFYRVGANTLKLFWYDPVLQQSLTVDLATGIDPHAGFDFPQDTGQSFTDALLFYVRNDTVFMRVQRDRFSIEYECPANEPGLRLVSNGLRVDNRYQAVYQFPTDDYTPPVVPVPEIPITGDYRYINSWGSCFVSNHKINVVSVPFKLGFKVSDAFYPRGRAQVMFGSNDRTQLYCVMGSGSVTIYRGYRRGADRLIVPDEDFNGEWEFEFFGLNGDVRITKDGNVIFDKFLVTPQPQRTTPTTIVFAGSETIPGAECESFHGAVYDCWVEQNGNRIDWPVQSKGLAQQPSVPVGTDMTIRNHRPQNWRLIQS